MLSQYVAQREAFPYEFCIKDTSGKPVDCSAGTVQFILNKFIEDAVPTLLVADSSDEWDKTRANDGIFVLNFSSDNLDLPQGKYLGEFSMTLGSTVTKSELIDFWVTPSLS
jgi:hypothetical protein